MAHDPDILCIGSVLWDVIGRAPLHQRKGSDVPGRIIRLPGGVAMNIAMTLSHFGLRPGLLSAVGRDREGEELMAVARAMNMVTDHVYRSDDLPTDQYMAIEDTSGLVAAIADAHSLEAAGDKILRPLANGILGSANAPYRGLIALDGNLTLERLDHIASDALFAAADLRVAPASPGKATRLRPFLLHGRGTLYVNLEEAGLLCESVFETSKDAATALVAHGAQRALVTDGANPTCDATAQGAVRLKPQEVCVTRVTGAGDTFMAAHIAAEATGANREDALAHALTAAAHYVSGGEPE
ncbi:MAG: PfkB family carbohydrate kinase [Rhodobacteraceae bacterium]|nr:PfkB family carbohydrate kinase [Paracoccaceae bacterium]